MRAGVSKTRRMRNDGFPSSEKSLFDCAEIGFKTEGGSHCSVCRSHVRHAVQVVCQRPDGASVTFDCLCTRCLVAEEARSSKVLLRFGGMAIESKGSRRKAA